ncbi:hypothetical protein [Deinococcus sp. Leaf326]|uniref:hypothetical protein n=1 Tax=Deinococcus sp. Leaf326 TaxID=1736338 RepID=UPI0007010E0A|nr:hypothetical protein [Deinococcus sp. Leaf326]KQR37768.1 hypothetical protein ASF71_14905 [Deinococcus sp. Leaf326]
MDAFLPAFTLLMIVWALAERQKTRTAEQRAEDLEHDLAHAQALGLKHQNEALTLRATVEIQQLALAKAQARETARQQLHHASGWSPQPDRPAWHRDHPQESPD